MVFELYEYIRLVLTVRVFGTEAVLVRTLEGEGVVGRRRGKAYEIVGRGRAEVER